MESLVDETHPEGLSAVLSRIVVDPAQVRSLHEILGPFCHQSRNVLNCLKMSLYLARREEERTTGSAWDGLERTYLKLEQFFDTIQTICRPMPLSLVRLSFSMLVEDRRRSWTDLFLGHQRSLELITPRDPVIGDYDPLHLGRALDAFVGWRAESGEDGESASFRWWTDREHFHLEWLESRAGTKRTGGRAQDQQEPLALPLLGRVISAHGGVMKLLEPSGRYVHVSWPQSASNPHRSHPAEIAP
jgi:hypothetical protein